MSLSITIILQATLLVLAYFISWTTYQRIRQRRDLKNLPGPAPSSFLSGNLDKYFAQDGIPWQQHLTDKYGSAVKLWGPFGEPQIYLSDPRGLENVLLKQSDVFDEPDFFLNMHHACFGEGVGAVAGSKHKKQRKRLGPSLTVNSVKRMAPQFYRIAHELKNVFASHINASPSTDEKAGEKSAEIDVLSWLSRAALEMIAQGGMGYSFDTLDTSKDPHPYPGAASDLSPQLARIPALLIMFLHPVVHIGSPGLRRLLSSLFPLSSVRQVKRILDVMDTTVLEIFYAKKAAMEEDKSAWKAESERNPNIISNLMAENKQVSAAESLSEEEIIGQMNALIFAAHDTTSGALTRTLHVLSENLDLQSRLRKEVSEARALGGDLDYEALMALPLLDATVREVLRLYPPVASLPRQAKRDAVIPLHYPVRGVDGQTPVKELVIRKGTTFYAGIAGANQNTDTWGPDARTFRPERWMESLPDSVMSAPIPGIYSHLMTFFGGPRSCMGMRFSILEMKIVLTVLLEAFEFKPIGREITWLNHHIMAPHVAGDTEGVHRMPLRVTPAPECLA